MKKKIIRTVIRTKLSLQSVEKASQALVSWKEKYVDIGSTLSEEQGRRSVVVPEMLGVDPEMTGWSYFQLLEHNAIVNQAMSLNVRSLMTGKGKKIIEKFNPKTDVLPKEDVGPEQIEVFERSVSSHLEMMKEFDHLKRATTNRHPVFGDFNAHMWHGMMGVHLGVHFKQLKLIVEGALKEG